MPLLTIEEALLDAPEEKSPKPMIKGVLGKLAPKEEAMKHRAVSRRKAQALLLEKRMLKIIMQPLKMKLLSFIRASEIPQVELERQIQ